MSDCSNLAQRECKKHHDKVASRVHWELSKKYDLECGEKFCEHKPPPVIENHQEKLVWNGSTITDRHVPHKRLDITTFLKDKHPWLMIDVAVLDDQNVMRRLKLGRLSSTRSLKARRIRQVEVVVVPLVIMALETVSKDFAKWQEYLGIPNTTECAQMSALLGTLQNSQKDVASLSCWRELRCDIVYPARIESWRELIIIIIPLQTYKLRCCSYRGKNIKSG